MSRDIGLLLPVFPVSWPCYFPQSIGQQDFSTDGFKAVATSHTQKSDDFAYVEIILFPDANETILKFHGEEKHPF